MEFAELKIAMEEDEGGHLEFKAAKNQMSVLGGEERNPKSVLGYCVAIGNEGGGKLILGISNKKPRKILGTVAIKNVEEVKSQIFKYLGDRIEIDELYTEDSKRVLVISIPSRPKGATFKFYGLSLMRVGEELLPMTDEKYRRILNEVQEDWSAQICPNALLSDLDPFAIQFARDHFKAKNSNLAKDVDLWDDETFLNKAKILKKGKVTNSAILLLGKPESAILINPAVAQITWILKGKDNTEKAYAHFSCPFLLSVDKVFNTIRNLKYRYIKDGSLFPEEVDMYDPYVIREALHNCIAHQDYLLNGRITLVESEDGFLIFTNKGDFLPGSVENVIKADSPSEYYQNRFLVEAMVNLNMVDTIGSGIKKMFHIQKERFFPMPSYDFANRKVAVRIYGKVLDMNYAKALARHSDLSLTDIILLDRIQKKKSVTKESATYLRSKGLVEGRYPNIFISENIAKKTGDMAQYIKNRGQKDKYYKELVVEYLGKQPGCSREEIDNLLMSMLPAVLTPKQKKAKVGNLLYDLSARQNLIINKGTKRYPKWSLI